MAEKSYFWKIFNDTMQTNILVTGAGGQLGSELRKLAHTLPEARFFFTDVPEMDITDEKGVREFVVAHRIDTIVNCAAYTNVDKAESNEATARKINARGPEVLAQTAADKDILLIHVSTDYVFDGTAHRPYREEDPVAPLGVYGKTKREGEEAVIASGCRSVILRTAWLYSAYGNNFVKTMLRLGAEWEELRVIFDQVGTPTYAEDLAAAVLTLLPRLQEEPQQGEIYHFTNEGVCSWYDFATTIMELSGTDCRVIPIETKDYPTAAERPAYSVLNKGKIKARFGLTIPHWEKSLKRCLSALQE